MATGTIQKSMVLLWTNPNPNNSFGAQTVSLDLTQFRFVMIEHHNSSNSGDLYFVWFSPVGFPSRINYLTYASGAYAHQRPIDVSTSGIYFDNANTNGGQTNTDIVPTKIFGIR